MHTQTACMEKEFELLCSSMYINICIHALYIRTNTSVCAPEAFQYNKRTIKMICEKVLSRMCGTVDSWYSWFVRQYHVCMYVWYSLLLVCCN